MKKVLTVVFTLMLVLGLSAVSSASVGIEGMYVTGTQSYDVTALGNTIEGSANGYALIARTSLVGPFGAEVHYTSLKGDDLEVEGLPITDVTGEVAKTDAFLTYQPFAALKLFGGYTKATTTLELPGFAGGTQESTVSGLVAGLQSGFKLGEKITVGGFYGLGFNAKYKPEGGDEEDADVTSLKLAVNYALNDTFTLEAGYAKDTAKCDAVDAAVAAYFVGAKASF